MKARRVVVTGLGAVTGLGHDVATMWSGLCEGRSGVGPITLFDTTEFRVNFGGQVRDFDGDAIFGGRDARRLDRFTQFALVAGEEAFRDAGLDAANLPVAVERCGSIVGSGIGGLSEFEAQHTNLMEKGPSRISPFTIPKLMANAAAGHLSIKYGLKGPSSAIATACASAANAMGEAYRQIALGWADLVITGGSEAAMTPMGLGGFASLRALSTRNEDPTRASRPFDKDRDGFVLSEGAGILIFEAEDVARKRGARIYAEVLGYGMSSDGGHITAPDEEGRGAALAIRGCLEDAGLNPEQIDYINAHGTSTGLGDIAETRAIKATFGEHAKRVAVSSTKSQLGHLLGASGGVELIAACLTVTKGVIPPTINLDSPDPECDLDYVPHTAREKAVRYALSNSFGFGGHNACLVVGRYDG